MLANVRNFATAHDRNALASPSDALSDDIPKSTQAMENLCSVLPCAWRFDCLVPAACVDFFLASETCQSIAQPRDRHSFRQRAAKTELTHAADMGARTCHNGECKMS